MLLQGMIHSIHGQHITGQVAADREQYGDSTANAFGWIGVALLIEVQHFAVAAFPFADDSAALRNDAEPITTDAAISGLLAVSTESGDAKFQTIVFSSA